MAKIYTRTGDNGTTSLFGGRRVPKSHERLEAYGAVDELNAFLGWFESKSSHADLVRITRRAQHALFGIGAHLATPADAGKSRGILPPLAADQVQDLETTIDSLDKELEPLRSFVLPGGAEDSALLHVARTVCRRAERAVVRAESDGKPILAPAGLAYLNRLSDLLFVMARVVNRRAGRKERVWKAEGQDDAG